MTRPKVLVLVVEVALEALMKLGHLNGEDEAHDRHQPKVQALRRKGGTSTPTSRVSGASRLSEEGRMGSGGACKQVFCRDAVQAHDAGT